MNGSLRPLYHFTAPTGWLNDPNGLVFWKGEYHLFYQHNPTGTEWGNMHWGHAVSRDLVRWSHLPVALAPDSNGACFSGSAAMDLEGATGLQTGSEPVMVAPYTGEGHGQCLAWSNDRGRTWSRWPGNPVLPLWPDRDPRLFWYAPERKWVIALYVETGSRLGQKSIAIYESKDLKEWTYCSETPGFYECPDLFPLRVKGARDVRWVLHGADGRYLVGLFDGHRFTAQSDLRPMDQGANFYAAQTWNGVPTSDGRRIQIAWMAGGQYPGQPFNQQMSFPCTLELLPDETGAAVARWPVREIRSLYQRRYTRRAIRLKPSAGLHVVTGEALDVTARLRSLGAASVTMNTLGTPITVDFHARQVAVGDKRAAMRSAEDVTLRVLIDRTSIELFADDGRVSMTSCRLPVPGEPSMYWNCEGGDVEIRNLHVADIG